MASTSLKTIIDSHVHLFPAEELDSFAWYTPDCPLSSSDHGLAEFTTAASSSVPAVHGFVFIETARKNDLTTDPPNYDGPLAELSFLRHRIFADANDSSVAETSSPSSPPPKCLGVIPWAPVPLGAEAVEKYLQQAEQSAGPDVWSKVKGFRFLVQDQPGGTMVQDRFIDGLRFLGRKGYVFDLGVDAKRRGKKHLDEAVEMLGRAHEGVPDDEKVTVIINHLCKPDLSILNPADPAFTAWRTAIYTLSRFPRTYLKLSGCFSEMPPSLASRDADDIVAAMLPWLGICLATFGARRIMFGSDWPVCTIDGGKDAWKVWNAVVERMCWMGSLDEEGVDRVYAGTAREAYRMA